MAENSGIEWTHHTFNPWIGCTKVSPACDHCYAEAWDNRFNGERWGPHAARTRTKTWGNPVKWNRIAQEQGTRFRVFCASLADVADNHRSIKPEWRSDLQRLIDETPNLDWLLLTKRPQNFMRFYEWRNRPIPENIWLGTTVENQQEANRRIPYLLEVPASVHFVSCEPLIGPLDLTRWLRPTVDKFGLNWVITGGESGRHFRHADPDWFRALRDQCADAGVPFLFKQWEGKSQKEIKAKGRELDGVIHDGYPEIGRLK